MRDYPSYGFEVISAKNFTLNGSPALVVDMLSRSKNKQIRQVVLKKEDRVAIMTCLDNRSTFETALVSCNQIMKSFSWNAAEASATPVAAPASAVSASTSSTTPPAKKQ